MNTWKKREKQAKPRKEDASVTISANTTQKQGRQSHDILATASMIITKVL